jgi:endoglucanase
MPNITPFLKSLLATPGLTGFEAPVAKLIADQWRTLVDEISASRVGSLYGFKRGALKQKTRPSILIAAHMDAIGLMVTQITAGGWIRVTGVGGVDARVLPGTLVTVHGRVDLPGLIVMPQVRLLPASVGDGPVGMEYLLVDTGLPEKEVRAKVQVGDIVSYATEPVELSGEVISGHSLDNRASVAALTIALEELQTLKHDWDVWAVASSQEEVSFAGGYTAAHEINPALAVAVDVTFGKGPGASEWNTFGLGKGVPIGLGPNLHPAIYKRLKETADRLEIPNALDAIHRHSGTDAFPIQASREGIPTGLLGIPLRYMHTPVEVVSLKDIERVGRLLAEFIAGLEPDFVEKIVWED